MRRTPSGTQATRNKSGVSKESESTKSMDAQPRKTTKSKPGVGKCPTRPGPRTNCMERECPCELALELVTCAASFSGSSRKVSSTPSAAVTLSGRLQDPEAKTRPRYSTGTTICKRMCLRSNSHSITKAGAAFRRLKPRLRCREYGCCRRVSGRRQHRLASANRSFNCKTKSVQHLHGWEVDMALRAWAHPGFHGQCNQQGPNKN